MKDQEHDSTHFGILKRALIWFSSNRGGILSAISMAVILVTKCSSERHTHIPAAIHMPSPSKRTVTKQTNKLTNKRINTQSCS